MLCTNRFDLYFQSALVSIEQQTLVDIEILVIVNGVSDSVFETMVRELTDERIRLIRSSLEGVTFSRNLALQEARADLIAVMDADDVAYPDRLAKQYQYLVDHIDISVLGANYDVVDEGGQVLNRSNLPLSDADIRRSLVCSNPICHPTTMFRREVALAVGGYSGGLAQDYELWLKLLSQPAVKFNNMADTVIGYRVPVVSKARKSRRAYAQVASAQFRQFAATKRPQWLLASAVSLTKAWFRSTQD